MESGTIAAQGYRLRVPYGTLLCVSDKPLHGEIKLPGAANAFYERAVGEHLTIGLAALDILRGQRERAAFPQAAQLRRAAVPVMGALHGVREDGGYRQPHGCFLDPSDGANFFCAIWVSVELASRPQAIRRPEGWSFCNTCQGTGPDPALNPPSRVGPLRMPW